MEQHVGQEAYCTRIERDPSWPTLEVIIAQEVEEAIRWSLHSLAFEFVVEVLVLAPVAAISKFETATGPT